MVALGGHAGQDVQFVFVGGFGSSAEGYRALVRAMSEASGRPVTFIDSRRWGSPTFRAVTHHNIPRPILLQALHLRDELHRRNIAKARLFGHSLGGVVVMVFALLFPDMVERVVVLGSAGIHVDGFRPLAGRMVGKFAGDIRAMWRHPDQEVRAIIRDSRRGLLLYLANVNRSLNEAIVASQYAAFGVLYLPLRQAHIRVCVGHGSLDAAFPLAQVEEILRALVPSDDFFVIDGAMHDVQFTPALTVAALKQHGHLSPP